MQFVTKVFGVLALGTATIFSAGAQPAQAATVHTDVNFTFSTPYGGRNYDFDIDGDGTDDLRLRPYYRSSYGRSGGSSSSLLQVLGLNGSLVGTGAPLSLGDPISNALSFSASKHVIGYSSRWWSYCRRWRGCRSGSSASYDGDWTNGDNTSVQGFLGIALSDNRFGWAELNLGYRGSGSLIAFGYETTQGEPIKAGAETKFLPVSDAQSVSAVPLPASMWMLFAGVAGLGLSGRLRRRG